MKTEFIAKEIFYSLSSINLSLSLSLSAITKHSIFTTHLSLSPTCHSSLSLFITRPLQSIKILQSPWTPLSPIQTHKFLRSTHFNQIPPNHLRVHLIWRLPNTTKSMTHWKRWAQQAAIILLLFSATKWIKWFSTRICISLKVESKIFHMH